MNLLAPPPPASLIAMAARSHDGIDWTAWLQRLRAVDQLNVDTLRELARRLLGPRTRTVVDVGSGAGGMSAAFAEAMPEGTVVLVDSAPELLDAAAAAVREMAGQRVEVRTVEADAADDALLDLVPHAAARGEWFRRMRADMEGSVRLPVGWNRALADAGLTDVGSFSYLVDHPVPPSELVREAVLRWLSAMREMAGEWLSEADRHTVDELLDPAGLHYVGRRDDVFVLTAHTVHAGTAGDPPR